MVAAADAVTRFYRARLATANAGLLAAIDRLWNQLFDPNDPDGSLARIGAAVGIWTTAGQAAAATETVQYLASLYAASTGAAYAEVAPFAVPEGLVGSAAATGRTVVDMARLAPAVYGARRTAGHDPELAAASAQSWLNRLGASEPYRVANTTIMHNAMSDGRLSGRVVRLTRPGACAFCVLIADRGYIPANAGFAAHANCRCSPSPEVSGHPRPAGEVQREAQAPAGPPPYPGNLSPVKAQEWMREHWGTDRRNIYLSGLGRGGANAVAAEMDRLFRAYPHTASRVTSFGASGSVTTDFNSRLGYISRISANAYADATRQGSIRFNANRVKDYDNLLRDLQRDVRTNWHPRGTGSLEAVAAHEFGHQMLWAAYDRAGLGNVATGLAEVFSAHGVAPSDYRGRENAISTYISRYANKNTDELVAEAFAEYRHNPTPRALSRDIAETVIRFAEGQR